jgi:hypothetical protein
MSDYIGDGFGTTIAMANLPTVKLKEFEVTPASMKGGGAINRTTHRNTRFRTQSPKKLISSGDVAMKVEYDPAVKTQITAQLQINQLFTLTYPTGDTEDFWGWLEEFSPDKLDEGNRGMASVVIIPSNMNDSGVETGPVYTEAS